MSGRGFFISPFSLVALKKSGNQSCVAAEDLLPTGLHDGHR